LDEIPVEVKADFSKPNINKKSNKPYWIIPDSQGILINLFHVFRKSGYCKDLIILVSDKTPNMYLEYLKERNYDYIV